jgi:hypothetical protein
LGRHSFFHNPTLGKRLEMDDTIIVSDKIFHLRYRGIVGSLGYLVNMTRPDLAFAYSVVGIEHIS